MEVISPRERILFLGTTSVTDLELLCVMLRTGPSLQKGQLELMSEAPVVRLARELLCQFGNLQGLFSAKSSELSKIRGLGPSKTAEILAIKEIALRLWSSGRTGLKQTVDSSLSAYRLFSDLAFESSEVVAVACLDVRHKVISREIVFKGSLTCSHVSPREILRVALKHNAARVLMAHNHPSQDPNPSDEDARFTRQLKRVGQQMGLELLDHIIVCREEKYFSFADAKWRKPQAVSAIASDLRA